MCFFSASAPQMFSTDMFETCLPASFRCSLPMFSRAPGPRTPALDACRCQRRWLVRISRACMYHVINFSMQHPDGTIRQPRKVHASLEGCVPSRGLLGHPVYASSHQELYHTPLILRHTSQFICHTSYLILSYIISHI